MPYLLRVLRLRAQGSSFSCITHFITYISAACAFITRELFQTAVSSDQIALTDSGHFTHVSQLSRESFAASV